MRVIAFFFPEKPRQDHHYMRMAAAMRLMQGLVLLPGPQSPELSVCPTGNPPRRDRGLRGETNVCHEMAQHTDLNPRRLPIFERSIPLDTGSQRNHIHATTNQPAAM